MGFVTKANRSNGSIKRQVSQLEFMQETQKLRIPYSKPDSFAYEVGQVVTGIIYQRFNKITVTGVIKVCSNDYGINEYKIECADGTPEYLIESDIEVSNVKADV